MGNLCHGMCRDRACKIKENTNCNQLDANKRNAGMQDKPKDNEADTGRIHHANTMNPAEKIGQAQQPKTTDKQRDCSNAK